MFDNIIGQREVVSELQREIARGTLPSALLFYGPIYTGKLTTALELARVLTCSGTREWTCPCRSCEQNRSMTHPYILQLGSRYFLEEILACADAAIRIDKPSTRYLFIRAVRKLLRRFDGLLWEGSKKNLNPVMDDLETVNEILQTIHPEEKGTYKLDKLCDDVHKHCQKITKFILTDSIPVNQIRRAAFWTHTTGHTATKIVILENIDKMADGSSNALLKILEEPPADTYFILITTKREGIIPTLKSRLRQYQFRERDSTTAMQILDKVFHEESGEFMSIKDYFLAWSARPDLIKQLGRRFFEALVADDPEIFLADAESEESKQMFKDRKIFPVFLEELTRLCRQMLSESLKAKGGNDELFRLFQWNEMVKKRQTLSEQLNVQPLLLTESLLYEMRKTQ